MAISQVGSFTLPTTAANPGVGITPTGAAAGDVLLFFVGWYVQNGATITPPIGATLVPNTRVDHVGTNDDSTTAVYMLILTGAPASTYTFSVSPAPTYGVGVSTLCLRGADPTAPIDVGAGAPTGNSGYSTAPTALGLTTTVANEYLCLFRLGDITDLTAPFPGFTTLAVTGGFDHSYATSTGYWGFYVKSGQAQGATGNLVATETIDDWNISLIAVVPPLSVTPNYTPGTDAIFFGMM